MKLLIIGATGMIGSRLVTEAVQRQHVVTAASRKGTAVEGAQGLALDAADPDAVTAAAAQADVIISAVSPRSTNDAGAEAMRYATALISAARDTGRRLVMVGGAGTLNLADGTPVAEVVPQMYRAEAHAMRAVYEALEGSGISFAFVAPAGEIAPGERSGTFRTGGRTYLTDAEGHSRISAEDYAIALLDEVETPAHENTVFAVAY